MSDLFHRPEYAREIAASLLRPGPLEQGARSGVFLSGMRRIGKTTFVRQDLMPELCKLGALPIYVDLWADKLRAPSALVHEAVREAVQSLPSGASDWLASLRRRVTGVDVGLGPLKLGVKLDSLGQPGGATLADVFEALVRHTQANVVLIVDEVQHAVGSEDGMHLLHALKAARDRVNTATDLPGKFIFLGTGSHKSLVADMATRRSHPFAGAVGAEFQVLGVDFVQWRLEQIARHDGRAILPSLQAAAEGFGVMGHRPEELEKALRELQRQGQLQAQSQGSASLETDALFRAICQALASAAADVDLAAIDGLGLLAAAIYARIARQECSGLFSADALAEYAGQTGVSVDVPQVQNTLNKMIAANLVLRVGHGRYEVADPFVRSAWLSRDQWAQALTGPQP